MEKYRPRSSLLEPATYQISILGTLDKKWSDYYGGMTIENVNNPERSAMTILAGSLPDQCALIGVLNSLHDIGCPILSVDYMGAG